MSEATEIEVAIDRMLRVLPTAGPDGAEVQLEELAGLVEAWGARMNLSGHRTALSICESLIGDAVGALAEIERSLAAPVSGRVIDLGSGAGFPGLPIAILRPSAEVFLVEIREKRHLFQRAAIRQIGIPNAHAVRARIEDRAPGTADLVIAQAVAPIRDIVELMRPYLEPGSIAVVPGGPDLGDPESAADLAPVVIDYPSPSTGQARRLWIGRRRSA